MAFIFKCKTGEAYQIKLLTELLSNNLKTGCFEINEDKICLRMFDHPVKTMVDIELISTNFIVYKYNNSVNTNISIGLNLNHLHKMLKSIKKKDILQLVINSSMQNELEVTTTPKDSSRITTSYIKIQNIQNVYSDIPVGYNKPININSSDFQKMCKELNGIGSNDIKIISYKYYIDFIADVDDILKRKVRLGYIDDVSDDYTTDVIYTATFATDQLIRINKIAGLSNIVQIFTGSCDDPIKFSSSIGNLGRISMYIKSKEIVEKELCQRSDSEDSD